MNVYEIYKEVDTKTMNRNNGNTKKICYMVTLGYKIRIVVRLTRVIHKLYEIAGAEFFDFENFSWKTHQISQTFGYEVELQWSNSSTDVIEQKNRDDYIDKRDWPTFFTPR